MSQTSDFVKRLNECPAGTTGWREFEDICIEILTFLFVPPLIVPRIQARSYSGIDRRDAIFPNREDIGDSIWAKLFRQLHARLIVCEFKNYDRTEINKEEVNQTSNYLTPSMGKLAIMCLNKFPDESAYKKRNTIYSLDGKVILFLTKEKLEEMLYMKERGEDPAFLIMDEFESFLIQHE